MDENNMKAREDGGNDNHGMKEHKYHHHHHHQQQQQEPLSHVQFRNRCFAMCFTSFTFGYIPLQLSSYAPFMVLVLAPRLDTTEVGTYTGLLNSALLIGRVLSAYFWTSLSDSYGRKGILIFASLGAAVMSVLFGMSQTLWQALLTRFVGGLVDGGGRGLVRVMSVEYAHGDPERRTTILSMDVTSRALGMILGPALSGFLAEPLTQYPNSVWLQDSSFLVSMLTRYPFILPNLFTALVCLLTFGVLLVWTDETLETSQIKSMETLPSFLAQEISTIWNSAFTLLCPKTKVEKDDDTVPTQQLPAGESTGLMMASSSNTDEDAAAATTTRETSLMADKTVRDHIIGYCVCALCLLSTVEAVPLFFMSPAGGLGLQEYQSGILLGSRGIWIILIQVFLLKPSIAKLGPYGALRWSTVSLYVMTAMPLGLLWSGPSGTINTYTVLFYCGFVWLCYTYFGCLFFVGGLVTINKTVSDPLRAKMNGILSVGGNIAFALAPLYAGILYKWCYEAPNKTTAAILYWTILGLLSGLICQYLFGRLKPKDEDDLN